MITNENLIKVGAEVNAILQNIPKDKYYKIPKEITSVFEECQDDSIKIDMHKNYLEQNISQTAKDIIFSISYNYWLSKNERLELEKNLKAKQPSSVSIENKKDEINSNVYTELYYLINQFDEGLKEKIPEGFIKKINDNREINSEPNLDFTKKLCDQVLMQETRILLSLIYRDFLCTQEKEDAMVASDKRHLEKIANGQFDSSTLFNKNNKENSPIKKEEALIEIQSTNWLKQIVYKVKKALKGDNKINQEEIVKKNLFITIEDLEENHNQITPEERQKILNKLLL